MMMMMKTTSRMATEPMIDITVKRVFVYRHDTLGWMAWADPPVRSFWCAMRCSGDVPTRRDAARWLACMRSCRRKWPAGKRQRPESMLERFYYTSLVTTSIRSSS